MKVVQFSRFGPPQEVAECIEAAEPPPPAADEVALEVLAFPINPADTLLIEGRYALRPPLPARVGAECLARVTAAGKSVTDLKPGDLVIPLERDNWVQRKNAKAAAVIKVPADIDPLQLAMLKVNPPTAYLMMTKYVQLSPGDWLLQDAANSGVGHCLIQLAKAEGLKTVNVVRREGLADELDGAGRRHRAGRRPGSRQARHGSDQGRAHSLWPSTPSAAARSCASATRSPTRRPCSITGCCRARTRSSAGINAYSSAFASPASG